MDRVCTEEQSIWKGLQAESSLFQELLDTPLRAMVSGQQQARAIEGVVSGLRRTVAMLKWQYRELLELLSSTALQERGKREDSSCKQRFSGRTRPGALRDCRSGERFFRIHQGTPGKASDEYQRSCASRVFRRFGGI